MGWVNSSQGLPVFLQRLPTRKYKQGLSRENLSASYVEDGVFDRYSVYDKDIDYLMRGDYPTLDELMASHKVWYKSHQGLALSKDVCVMKSKDGYDVYVERDIVGKFHPEARSVEVTKEGVFSVVHRELEEVGLI